MIQKEYIGAGTIHQCKGVLGSFAGENIFLVTGKTSYSKSKAKEFLRDILSNYKVTVFNDSSSGPKIEDVKLGVDLFKKNKADVVIAIGGGSIIDMAKLINFFSVNKMNDLSLAKLNFDIKRPTPLIAIPTTAGSGSQATHFAVVYKEDVKYSVAHKYILPDIAIVDMDLTKSLSKKQTAISGIDALSQAIESYWSVNSTEESKRYAKKAIELILPNLTIAVDNGARNSREAMAEAAHLAGKAINIAKTTAAHAVSYLLTVFHNIPHGHAVALTMAKFFIVNSKPEENVLNEQRGKSYLKKTINEISNLFGCASSQDFAEKWYKLMRDVGLETDFKTLGISKQSDIDRIIRNVNMERLDNNPARINEAILRQIFE